MPLQPCDGGYNTDEAAEVGDMLLLVDAMLENASADDKVQVCYSFFFLYYFIRLLCKWHCRARWLTCLSVYFREACLLQRFLSLLGPQKPHSTHSGVHGVSFSEAVWRHLSERSVPTYEWGLH